MNLLFDILSGWRKRKFSHSSLRSRSVCSRFEKRFSNCVVRVKGVEKGSGDNFENGISLGVNSWQRKFNTFCERTFFSVLNHDRKKGWRWKGKQKKMIINFSKQLLRSNVEVDIRQYFPFTTMSRWKRSEENFHQDLHTKFSPLGDIFSSPTQTGLCMRFHYVSCRVDFFMLQYAQYGGEDASSSKWKHTKLLRLIVFIFRRKAFWFIIKEEKLNNSELIKWFRALISSMLLPFSTPLSIPFKLRTRILRLCRAKYDLMLQVVVLEDKLNQEDCEIAHGLFSRIRVYIKLNSNISKPIALNGTTKTWISTGRSTEIPCPWKLQVNIKFPASRKYNFDLKHRKSCFRLNSKSMRENCGIKFCGKPISEWKQRGY